MEGSLKSLEAQITSSLYSTCLFCPFLFWLSPNGDTSSEAAKKRASREKKDTRNFQNKDIVYFCCQWPPYLGCGILPYIHQWCHFMPMYYILLYTTLSNLGSASKPMGWMRREGCMCLECGTYSLECWYTEGCTDQWPSSLCLVSCHNVLTLLICVDDLLGSRSYFCILLLISGLPDSSPYWQTTHKGLKETFAIVQ